MTEPFTLVELVSVLCLVLLLFVSDKSHCDGSKKTILTILDVTLMMAIWQE